MIDYTPVGSLFLIFVLNKQEDTYTEKNKKNMIFEEMHIYTCYMLILKEKDFESGVFQIKLLPIKITTKSASMLSLLKTYQIAKTLEG